MDARYYDGLTAKPHEVRISAGAGGLLFVIDGDEVLWPIGEIRAEPLGAMTRLSRPGFGDARLMVDSDVWRAIAGEAGGAAERRERKVERRLIAALVGGAVLVALFVFVGMPLASGPLARNTPPAFERQIGDSFDAQLSLAMKDCEGEAGQDALYVFGDMLEGSDAEPFNIRVRAVEAPFANAFALPGGAVLVTDDLIDMAEDPNELAAVIAHEVAHVERRHVMQAVWRSLGLGVVLDAVVGGGTGAGQQLVLLLGSFTDLRFSRDAEREADAHGMALLHAHGLSSQGFAPFFERIAAKDEGEDAAIVKELVSSHPESLRRAETSRARARPGDPGFNAADWAAIKAACEPARPAKTK